MVNVAKATRRLYGAEVPVPLRSLLRAMAEQAVRLYGLAMDAYAEGDASLAAALDDMDDRLDQLHKDYIQAILELHADVGTCRWRCSSRSSAATTSASATTP